MMLNEADDREEMSLMDQSAMGDPHQARAGKFRIWVKRLAYLALGVMALLIVTFIGLYVWLEDEIVPAFDPASARRLSAEKRRQYDVQFFNQIAVRGELPFEPRYQLFRRMAADGFEVAHLALHLFGIRYSVLPQKSAFALDRLKELARQGDVSAQCFYGIYGQFFEAPTSENEALRSEYIKAAARKNHPTCLVAYGVNFAASPAEEMEWTKKAAEGGDMNAQLSVAVAYGEGKLLPLDLGLAFCWVNEAQQSGTVWSASHVSTIHGLEYEARKRGETVVVRKYRPGTNCSELED